MERLSRIARFWSWLPAFRAVGETEHLPTAGDALSVGPPALSRAIRLLERDLGVELFQRTGQRLVLNDAGKALLEATRTAMRAIHDGMLQVRSEEMSGPVRIFSSGVITTAYVVPALQRLRRRWNGLLPQITGDSSDVVPQLLAGKLDLAFHSQPISDPLLTGVRLGTVTSGVYCGQGHPLYRRRKVSLEEIVEHEFVAPPPDASGQTVDGWPNHVLRRFGMHTDQMRVGRDVCAAGDLLAVLPDALGRQAPDGRRLYRLPVDILPPTPLFATHRPAISGTEPAVPIVQAVQREIDRTR